VALAVLEVAGAPAQTRKLVLQGQVVVVIGGGKAGILCLAEAKRQGAAKTVAIDCTQEAVQRLSSMSFVDEVIQADARNAVEVMDKVWATTKGRMGDVVISAANVAGTEMAGVLSCRPRGIVYFFSLATSFTRAALGAEAVGADLDLRIGNGYTEGHAELALGLVRENPDVRRLFLEQYS
jgi:L-erythro-3,5-diaminohexanoate dehydrogenase